MRLYTFITLFLVSILLVPSFCAVDVRKQQVKSLDNKKVELAANQTNKTLQQVAIVGLDVACAAGPEGCVAYLGVLAIAAGIEAIVSSGNPTGQWIQNFIDTQAGDYPTVNTVVFAYGYGTYWGYCNAYDNGYLVILATPEGASCCLQHYGDGGWVNWGYYGEWNRQDLQDYVQICVGPPGSPLYVAPGSGFCVDATEQNNADGTRLISYNCNGQWNQNWKWVGQNLVNDGGKCLDRNQAQTSDGTPVQLWDCNGGPAQTWVATAAHELKSPDDNSKCLDVTSYVGDGQQLEMWDCNGGANQQFTF
jgi:hypothetical protein